MIGKSTPSDTHPDGPDAPSSSSHDLHDLPLSPISEASSGYFSTSISTATLSDVSVACGDLIPTPNTHISPVVSRLGRENSDDCLVNPVNASVAPVEAGLKSDPVNLKDTEGARRNGVTNSQHEAHVSANPDGPFSLQKVKANELRSFSNIVGQDKVDDDRKATTTQQRNTVEKLEITVGDVDKDAESKELAWLKVGGRVTVGSSKSGTVRYVGPTHFSEGVWVGVELDTSSG